LFIRAILRAETAPETLVDLAVIAKKAGLELLESPNPGELILVTDQIKKAG